VEGSRSGADTREVGVSIRAARRRRAMTVSALAIATDLNKAYISRIERGQKAPSLAALLSIAGTLNVSVAQLLGETVDDSEVHLVRADAAGAVPIITGKRLSVMRLSLGDKPLDRDTELGGETLIHGLTGAVEIDLPDRRIILGAGDWLMFEGHVRHRLSAVDGRNASVLAIVAREDA